MQVHTLGVRLERLSRAVCVVGLALAACMVSLAQAPVEPPVPPSAPPARPRSVRTEVLYRAFFGHIQHLERRADEREAKGKDGRELREYYGKRLALSIRQTASLKQQAARTLLDLDRIDRQIQTIIQAVRARYPGGIIAPGQAFPQPPPELALLDQEKDAVTMQGVAQLRGAVGSAAFEKVESFLQNKFSRNFTEGIVLPNSEPPAISGWRAVKADQ